MFVCTLGGSAAFWGAYAGVCLSLGGRLGASFGGRLVVFLGRVFGCTVGDNVAWFGIRSRVYIGVRLGAWMCVGFVGVFAGVWCGNFAAIRARGEFWG